MLTRNNAPHELSRQAGGQCRQGRHRRGSTLVIFAIFLIVLLGMLGFVVDLAIMRATHRQAQNAADAAALAAAYDRLRGYSESTATTTASTFVQEHNGLNTATTPTVNFPPASGAYAGQAGFVEVIVNVPIQTLFIHVLGITQSQQVSARAVAGFEPRSAGEGVMVLDPTAKPGLDVSGGGTLRVQGRVVVNSEGGGVDESGSDINNGSNLFAARGGQPNSTTGVYAIDIDVVGGVDKPASFKPYDPGDPAPLRTRQSPEPDPLINLATPTTANGVDSRYRGEVKVTGGRNGTVDLGIDTGGQNHVAVAQESVAGGLYIATGGEAILHPGVYGKIDITGGAVYFIPGIYVISPKSSNNIESALKITGGTVIAERVMFYNTANSYNANTGSPDSSDGEGPPGFSNGSGEFAGGFNINAGMKFSPIDVSKVNYASLYTGAPAVSADFTGMLFYQRRKNPAGIQIGGDSSQGLLSGTLYAKWSNFQISGQGTYDAQFIAGSISVTGQGTVTIRGAGEGRGKANEVYLVE